LAFIAALLVAGAACGDAGDRPLLTQVLVPAGPYRAQARCTKHYQRDCKLSDPPPYGKRRHRVFVWLAAFWADTELVTRIDYEVCRISGACPAPGPRLDRLYNEERCGSQFLAIVRFDDAVAYCQWRGWRLPTPDEFDRMQRFTDGRKFAPGFPARKLRDCETRPSPEGIRSLHLREQWVNTFGHPAAMGGHNGAGLMDYFPREAPDSIAPFRCVRSLFPSDVGYARLLADQSDPWLRGGPD
jgi:hypothetical protein